MKLDNNTKKVLRFARPQMREMLAIIISKRTRTPIEEVREEINNYVQPKPVIPE